MQDRILSKPLLLSLIIFASAALGIFFAGFQGGALNYDFKFGKKGVSIKVAGVPLFAELAESPKERRAGLSGRKRLAPREGMLFVFEKEGKYKIWMKDMNFPLDVFWIDKNGRIVDIWKNAMPDSYPNYYSPAKPAKYILETNSDFADIHDIVVGDIVEGLPN